MFVKMLSDRVSCSMLICILTVIMWTAAVETHELKPPSSDFSRHNIVQPVVLQGRTKREIFTTRDTSGGHHSEVTMKVPIEGEELVLDLWLNQDLLTDNHVLSYQKNGKTVVHTPKKEELDLCHYGGSVRDKPGSWVAVSTCHGVQGIMFDGERMQYIEPAQEEGVNGKHYVYSSTDLSKALPRSFHPRITNSSYVNLGKETLSRHKRYASPESEIRMPYNANKNSRYVELVLVADKGLYEENQGDVRKVHRQMKALANIINALYSPLNIFVALVGVEVWANNDKIQIDADSSVTLDNFMKYRSTNLVKTIPNDNAHLITTQDFNFGVVGKAHPEKICSLQKSGGIESYYTDVTGLLAMAIAHEMGHNLGMHHDEEVADCECQDKRCIMSSTSSRYIPVWSTCSLNSLANSFSKGVDYCLKNKPKQLFSSPTCGNGFVEPGEQCDCGTMAVAGAYNPCHACCDPNTCMLRANAMCGAGMCCDLQTCRPKSARTVCRSADRECDLPEYCTGQSEYCPDDVYKMDTTPCGQDGQSAYCMRGECRSHSVQCRLLWGPTGKSSHDNCYNHNTQGDKNGDCGYDFLEDRYSACHENDIMCGRLQCNHLSESRDNVNHLEFGSGSPYTSLYKDGATVGPCYTVAIDLGVNDVGLVPDGAKCGHDMMCLNQRCMSVAAVRATMATSVCPSNCSGHGVCDSTGQCQCEPGYDPPNCTLRRRDDSNSHRSDYNRPVVKSTTQNPTVHNNNTPGIRNNSQNTNKPRIRDNHRRPTTPYYTRPGISDTTQERTILNNNIPVIITNFQNPTRSRNRINHRKPTTHNYSRPGLSDTTHNPIILNNNIPVIITNSQNPTRPRNRNNHRKPTTHNYSRPGNSDTTHNPIILNNNIPVIITDSQNPTRPKNRNKHRKPTTHNYSRPGISDTTHNPIILNNNIPVIITNSQNPTRPRNRNNHRKPTVHNYSRPGISDTTQNPITLNNNIPVIITNSQNPTSPRNRNNHRKPTTHNYSRPRISDTTHNPLILNNNIPVIITNSQNPTRPRNRNNHRKPIVHNYSRPRISDSTQNPITLNNNIPVIITNFQNPTRPRNRNNDRNPNSFNNYIPRVQTNNRNQNIFNNNIPRVDINYRNTNTVNNNWPGIRNNYRHPKQTIRKEPYVDTSSTDSSNWMVALYVFLGIIPLILLVLFLMYHFRSNLFKQYKDFQRKLSIKSNAPENSVPKQNSPVYTISTERPGPIYANNDHIKTHKTPDRNYGFPEEVIQKISAANDISNVFDAKQMTGIVVKPKFSPPSPPRVKPKSKMHVSRENIPTSEVKGAGSKSNLTVNTKHRMYSIESSSLYRNIAKKKNVNYSPIE